MQKSGTVRRVTVRAYGGPGQLTERCVRLAGGAVLSYTADPSELRRRASDLVEAVRAGWLSMGEGTAYDLARAAEAHRDIEGRGTRGKLYLTP